MQPLWLGSQTARFVFLDAAADRSTPSHVPRRGQAGVLVDRWVLWLVERGVSATAE
jgi:hypothetical protein